MASVIVAAASWGLAMVSPYQSYLHSVYLSKPTDVLAELGPHLSANASILLPGSERFQDAITRWNKYKAPDFSVAVEVANERDIQLAVEYANRHGLPFLAVGAGHGATEALSTVQNGLAILTRKMNHVRVDKGGQTATIGAGVLSKEVTDALWAVNKQTVTGFCECIGLIGPMLGGGHGLNQGKYGLVADNLVEAKVVLANGSLVTTSAVLHPDLFWAIRGAGHNFGIVSEFTYKIYDVQPDNHWTFETYIYTGDKVEALFETVNDLARNDTEQAEFAYFAYFLRIPPIDPDNAVVIFFIMFEGQPHLAEEMQVAYRAVGPVHTDSKQVIYPEIPPLMYIGMDDIGCLRNRNSFLRAPIGLKEYNIPAQRAVYDMFNDLTAIPAFNASLFAFEGYLLRAVKAVPAENAAFPDRHNDLMVSPIVIYEADVSLDDQAVTAAHEMRDVLQASTGVNTSVAYVNYADWTESAEEIYGIEPWRLERLRELKKSYDPHGRFSFYAPIRV